MKKKKIDFNDFSNSFLYCFCFKLKKRPSINLFVKLHFKVYSILYENIYSVQEYAKKVVEEKEKEQYGMILKNNI